MKKRLFVFLCIAITSFMLIGCSAIPPKSVVSNFLDSVIAGDLEKAGTYVYREDENKDFFEDLIPLKEDREDFAKIILSRLSYEIHSQEISGGEATVTTAITSPDLVRIVTKSLTELIPMAFAMAFSDGGDDEMDAFVEQYFTNSISDPNAPTTTTKVDIKLSKVDGKWLVVPDDKLLNAMTGNIVKAFQD